MSNLNQRLLMLRECSNVRRAHGIPYNGDYSVGKHSFDMLVLLLELWPDASLDLIKAVMYHDFSERWVGDMPCVACWDDGALDKAYKAAQVRLAEKHNVTPPELTSDDMFRLRFVDKLELWMWAHEQAKGFGNKNAARVIDRLLPWFKAPSIWSYMPEEAKALVNNFQWERTE